MDYFIVWYCYFTCSKDLDATHGFFHYQASVLFLPADIAVYCLEYEAIEVYSPSENF